MRRILLATISLCAVSWLAWAQQARPLHFEAATIKLDQTQSGGVRGGCHGVDSHPDPQVSIPLGRCVILDGRLSHMMSMAFGLPMNRISGFPDWDGPSRWDVEAEVENPNGVTEAQLNTLLQNYLVATFQLRLRQESREETSYLITVSNPAKLRPSHDTVATQRPGDSGQIVMQGATLQDLATFLSGLPTVGRPVADATHLPGRYDFTLDYLGQKPNSMVEMKTGLETWTSVFRDLQDQLGLKLVPGKSRVETIVIESAKEPHGGSCTGC